MVEVESIRKIRDSLESQLIILICCVYIYIHHPTPPVQIHSAGNTEKNNEFIKIEMCRILQHAECSSKGYLSLYEKLSSSLWLNWKKKKKSTKKQNIKSDLWWSNKKNWNCCWRVAQLQFRLLQSFIKQQMIICSAHNALVENALCSLGRQFSTS